MNGRRPRRVSRDIRISGSSLQGNAFATGDGSRAEVWNAASGNELQGLRQALLDAHRRGDIDAEVLREAGARLDDVEHEVAHPAPRMARISQLLDEVAEAVSGVRDAGAAAQAAVRVFAADRDRS